MKIGLFVLLAFIPKYDRTFRVNIGQCQRAAKGGTQKGVGHFFCFGHLLVTILSLF